MGGSSKPCLPEKIFLWRECSLFQFYIGSMNQGRDFSSAKFFFLTMSVTRDVSQDALIDIQIKRIHEYKRSDLRENRAMTWGSKPMKNTIFWGMNIQKSQLFWCENQGTRVLTHRHMVRNKFLFTFFCWTPKKQRALSRPMTWWVT